MKACDFCIEFDDTKRGDAQCLYPDSLPSRLLFREGDFNVFPCLGSIEFGHLLISPADHHTALSQLTEADLPDYRRAVDRIVAAFESHFGKTPAFFEHGDPTGRCELQGPCVSHAHVHVAPSGLLMLGKLRAHQAYLTSSPLARSVIDIDQPYLMCTDSDLIAHYFAAEGTPRQYLRQLYAEALNNPDGWNWAVNLDLENTAKESVALKTLF